MSPCPVSLLPRFSHVGSTSPSTSVSRFAPVSSDFGADTVQALSRCRAKIVMKVELAPFRDRRTGRMAPGRPLDPTLA